MFDQFKSIAKPYVRRFRKALTKAVAFVKGNKEVTLACVGVATVAVVGVALRSVTNTVPLTKTVTEDDWFAPAMHLVVNGVSDILIAVNSETGESVICAPDELIENTLSKHSSINIEF